MNTAPLGKSGELPSRTNAPSPGGPVSATRPRFALVGTGLLADAVAAALAEQGSADRVTEDGLASLDSSYTLLVVATDEWDTSPYPRLRRGCAQAGPPWLPVRAELGTAVVGPLERPGVPGCVHCMHTRRQRTRLDPDAFDAVWQRHFSALAKTPSSWLTGLGCDTAAAVVASAAATLTTDPARASQVDNAAVFVDLERLTVARHPFLPEPLCPECGRLPDDTPELAEITLAPRPKPTPHTYRVRPVIEELDTLVDTYVDRETGLIRTLGSSTAGGLTVAVAAIPQRAPGKVTYGYGRTREYRTSELVAILEAIERWGGMQAGGRRTVVCASYAELTGHALDPRTLGLHPADSYQLPDFGFRAFGEDEVCRWVWGYSFARREPVLVPETAVYYSNVFRTAPEDRGFAQETSSGCALGACLEEAILHGLLEVAERDAFLMAWYARMPVPRIDLDSARDRTIPLQAAAITAETGHRVAVYDTTLEQGIPCVWVIAASPGDDPGRAKAACAGGAHPHPERAILQALSEVGPQLVGLLRRFPDEADQARRMAADPGLVRDLPDHTLLYGAYETFGRLDFLTTSTAVRSLADMHAHTRGAFGNADLRDDLIEALRRYLDTGMDVVVVDQTTPEHRAGGFACVKVLVPGTVPITFGHHHRRLDGLPRLYEIPHRLGYQPRPSLLPSDHYSRQIAARSVGSPRAIRRVPTHDELNPHPHPFP